MNAKQYFSELKKDDNLDHIAEFVLDVLKKKANLPIPVSWIRPILPWILSKIFELMGKVLPDSVLGQVVSYISDELSEDGVLDDKEAERYISYINSEVNIPWVPESIERKLFAVVVHMISFAANSGIDAITMAKNGRGLTTISQKV